MTSVIEMKKCEFCGKEISYHEMYCSEECQKNAKTYYKMQYKYQGGFGVINGIFVMAIGIGIFLYALVPNAGVFVASFSMIVLGFLYYFLPFAPDVMIRKYQLKKSIMITRLIALALLTLGFLAILLHTLKVI